MYALTHQPVPPLVAKVLEDIADGLPVDIRALYAMQARYNRLQDYGLAKRHNVLVDGSGEALAGEFKEYFNLYEPQTYP